jgi:cytochrome bd-type quinol oxidase subunit 2
VTVFHRVLGTVLVLLFVAIVLTGLVLRLMGRRETPAGVWAMQHWTENLLILQTVGGIVLLLMGRRAVGDGIPWFHYLYGSLFPLIAVVGGRLAGLRREDREYVGLVWGAFFAFGLTLRAIQTGCGPAVSLLRCVGL